MGGISSFEPNINSKIPLEWDNILALDPGKSTGICVVRGNLFGSKTILFGDELWDFLDKTISSEHINKVVIENFLLYAQSIKRLVMDDLLPCRIIGVVEFLCFKHNKPLKKQMATQVKTFWTDDRLKYFGVNASNLHEKDAARHALEFMRKK